MPKLYSDVDYACSITGIYIWIFYVYGRKSSDSKKQKTG